VQKWYAETGDYILRQMRRLGFSADWSRMRFTMDDAYCEAVRLVFVELWKQGLIYRGPRIVNWCPRDLSSISDLEVEYEEADEFLYYIDYPVEGGGVITVATARPETMVGDTGVAVRPGDKRYRHLVGKFAVLPLLNRRLPVVADEAVDPKFGSGAVKVTPGHDATDYEIGERHGLEALSILHPNGRMNIPEIPRLDGRPVPEARAAIVEMLNAAGALNRIEPYHHSVGHCDRCGAVIEPLISAQWWVRMKPLAGPAIRVAESGEVGFVPERFKDQYLRWMRNIRDWNISRQIWLGHRIPVWTCANGHQLAYRSDPASCEECGSKDLSQDPDVLDTWFSSALWPFATLGWPEDTEDMRRFYPTQVLDTGRDILYLWVARMIFMSLHFTGKIPFTTVLIHGNVLDAEGRRMSKSLGNGVDPLEMIERYGADATRAWCAYFGTSGQDIRFFEDRIKDYSRFGNKLWNATRLVLSKLEAAPAPGQLDLADRWIIGRLSSVIRETTRSMERLEFGPAINAIYEFLWNEFADHFLELMKVGQGSPAVAAQALETTMRLLHPIMPFITEELWQRLPHEGETIMFAAWPTPDPAFEDASLEKEMHHLLYVVREIRHLRHEAAPRSRHGSATLETSHPLLLQPAGKAYLATLAQVHLDGSGAKGPGRQIVVGETRVTLNLPGDSAEEDRRLRAELNRVEREIEMLETKFQDSAFTSKAPEVVVQRERDRLARAKQAAVRLGDLLSQNPVIG
jgi:valyl-tRNA synthetase